MKYATGKIFVQIGTNNGNDDFRNLCRQYKPSLIILVEPNSIHNDSIVTAYEGILAYHIENVAITTQAQNEVTLVIPKNRPKMYNTGNYSLLPMDDWGDDFNKVVSKGITFSQLCENYGITEIEYLQIDTEGYDSEIIKSIDFSKVKINKIRYEKWGFPTDAFTRHGDKGKEYGIAGMKAVHSLLVDLGYVLIEETSDILAIKIKSL